LKNNSRPKRKEKTANKQASLKEIESKPSEEPTAWYGRKQQQQQQRLECKVYSNNV
ncbi:unnamed protein product, partial [Ceratitis capitata]